MKRLIHTLLLLAILGLTGCGTKFRDFSIPDGSFSIKMPGNPTTKGGPNGAEGWEVITGKWCYAVVSQPLPPQVGTLSGAQATEALDAGVKGMLSSFSATQRGGSLPISVNGFQGTEFEMAVPARPRGASGSPEPASTAVVRIYALNAKIVILVAQCTSDINRNTDNVKTFLDSFKPSGTASPGGMAGMPGGMRPPPNFNSGNMGGSTPPAGPPGYPVAGTNPGTYPMPNGTGTPMPGSYPGSYPNSSGSSPMPNGTSSTSPNTYPNGNYTNPNGSYPSTAGTSNSRPGPYANSNGVMPMPMPTNNSGATPSTYPGANANGFGPLNQQANKQPDFTGTPVTDDMKIKVGDLLQVYFNNQWVDVKVLKVPPSGLIQVRTQDKPFITDVFPRSRLQLPPGADDPEVASDDTQVTDPSGLPNSKGTGLPNSKPSGFAPMKSTGFANADPDKTPKPRPTGFTNSNSSSSKPTTSRPETVSGGKPTLGAISLDEATVDELLQIIAKKTEHRRVQAAEKLRSHSEAGPNPDVAKKLVALLQADQLTVRIAVAQALEKWACPEINAAVLKNLSGGTTEVRQSMMRIAVANSIEGSIPAIVKCLIDLDDRKVATESVLAIGAAAEADVIKLLDHRDAKVRQTAREILQEIGSAPSITALTKYADKWSGSERMAARKILKALEAKK